MFRLTTTVPVGRCSMMATERRAEGLLGPNGVHGFAIILSRKHILRYRD